MVAVREVAALDQRRYVAERQPFVRIEPNAGGGVFHSSIAIFSPLGQENACDRPDSRQISLKRLSLWNSRP